MTAGDLRVSVTQRKPSCVIDPALALGSPRGAALALRLADAFEAWLTRSFWQLLDASDLLPAAKPIAGQRLPDAQALARWQALRDSTDAGAWALRWLGDCVAESQLAAAREAVLSGPGDLIERYEQLLEALQARLPALGSDGSIWQACIDLDAGSADAITLSAALDGAPIVCAAESLALPSPVRLLKAVEIASQGPELSADEPLLVLQRERLRMALVAAGTVPAAVVLRLAAVHVLAGDGAAPWSGARAWWYWL